MNILFLDLASHDGLLACVTERAVVTSKELSSRADDGDLVARYEQLLAEAQWKKESLTHLACITGPGGFMSLRVAVSFMNTLSEVLDVPLCGIHLSDLCFTLCPMSGACPACPSVAQRRRWELSRRVRSSNLWWLHSTKSQELFVRKKGSGAFFRGKRLLTPFCALPSILGNNPVWCGELLPAHLELVKNLGGTQAPLSTFRDVLPAFLASQTYQKEQLVPWYGRHG